MDRGDVAIRVRFAYTGYESERDLRRSYRSRVLRIDAVCARSNTPRRGIKAPLQSGTHLRLTGGFFVPG